MKAPTDVLVYAGSESDATMLYASGFLAGDPFIFLRVGGRSMLVMSDLELGRARDESKVDEVVPYSAVEKKLKGKDGAKRVSRSEVIARVLADHGVAAVSVPDNFPLGLAVALRKQGVQAVPSASLFPERAVKTPGEVAAIEAVQRATEEATDEALKLLRRSKPRGSKLVVGGETVTSELLKGVIHRALMDRECAATRTIVAGGDQACDPHCTGTGPVAPDRSIVMDIFPRSTRTYYHADMSRTVVRGKASPALVKLFKDVQTAQEAGIAKVKPGADGKSIHEETQKLFKEMGYATEPRGGKMVGYFHGLGHGVGLDVHESPWLTSGGTPLPEHSVVTVEPGLYYPGLGGVRLEDMVLVTSGGCRNLTRYPKELVV